MLLYMCVFILIAPTSSVVLLNLDFSFPLRETRGKPPPDVVSGENVTLPSSFIALRREAITLFFSLRFSFCSMFIQQNTSKQYKNSDTRTYLQMGSGLVLFLHGRAPPHHQSRFNLFFIFSVSRRLPRSGGCGGCDTITTRARPRSSLCCAV